MVHYHLVPGVWQKLRCLAELCFVPTLAERILVPLPPSFSFLYYLVRPLRLTCKWAWRLLQATLSGDRPLEPGLRSEQARAAFASAWPSLAFKARDLAAYCLQPSGRTLDFGPWAGSAARRKPLHEFRNPQSAIRNCFDLGRWTLALAPNVIRRNARRFPTARPALLYLLIGLLCILSLRATSNAAPVSLMVQVRPEARLDQDAFSFELMIGPPALELGVQ